MSSEVSNGVMKRNGIGGYQNGNVKSEEVEEKREKNGVSNGSNGTNGSTDWDVVNGTR